jgi:hypothetical protein
VDEAPRISLRQISVARATAKGDWACVWRVENQGADRLDLLVVRLPHGQFKSPEYRFEPVLRLAAQERAEFKVSLHCDEPEGLVTENAFLIFQAFWQGAEWRIFVRVRVTINPSGAPAATTELVTTQRVGFSLVSG